jgi:hypothetical protein
VTDDQLRALVRDAVARHAGGRHGSSLASRGPGSIATGSGPEPRALSIDPRAVVAHPSHYQYLALVNVGEACVIEPDVTCHHCGYCRSHGH